ncbi:pyrimidine-nucleoside phosphorylase [Ardenticatena maritima]|uniref:Pyrimidine-nucleoside phosphorylase n=1 Tax=Ardenticatena maritima TaxID=872965 RepID=A0A0M8K5I5_9CHLR|nr:thymidine phosphorylase [Ardenticatena maritima]KPL89458.1 thymidine phosphorylase [Ardenticatena maritima]GAP62115.1 pyrimidine-nucleoside phosphorylase [Ardenticatena maritima]
MRAVDIIAKKRDGHELTDAEIEWFIQHYTDDTIPDYQAAAWAMAVFFRGMTPRETATLTRAMAHSGAVLDLHHIAPRTVDKHSSGGVGDKTTLVVGPLVAASGLPVAKMSGRGLSFTGGTLDKLESIPGFRVGLTHEEFMRQVAEIGLVVAGQTADLAPADGKLYALRDATATVDSIPLIASSIMSKKLAGGADAIVLDVKVGNGAFMQTLEAARELATLMVEIGVRNGRDMTALISDMNQPLGAAVGNAVEVQEAIETLQGNGPRDFTEHCLTVAAHMLLLGEKAETFDAAYALAEDFLRTGKALEKFKQMVAAQGGDVRVVETPATILPQAPIKAVVQAPQAGYIAGIKARDVGMAVVLLGGGREKKGDPIDHAVGVLVHHKVGDFVERGEPLFTILARTEEQIAPTQERLLATLSWSDTPVEPLPLFYDTIQARASA